MGAAPDWDARLRAAGLRCTAQRRAVLQALHELRHATVDELAAHLDASACDVNLSTVYRTLETLDEVGLVELEDVNACLDKAGDDIADIAAGMHEDFYAAITSDAEKFFKTREKFFVP